MKRYSQFEVIELTIVMRQELNAPIGTTSHSLFNHFVYQPEVSI